MLPGSLSKSEMTKVVSVGATKLMVKLRSGRH